MAARARKKTRGKTTRKKATRSKKVQPRGLAGADLPRTLREFRRRMLANLNRLERDVQRTRALARRRATRLLREASHWLGRLEARGERGWRELNTRARRELAALLRRMERAVAPTPVRKTARQRKA